MNVCGFSLWFYFECLSDFSCAFLPFICVSLWSDYLNILPMFLVGFLPSYYCFHRYLYSLDAFFHTSIIFFLMCGLKVKSESHSLRSHGLYSLWNCPGHNTGVGSPSLLQGIFPTQVWTQVSPHCSLILYQLRHKGSPRILELVAYPFPSGSSRSRNRTGVSCTAGRFFTNWAIREALNCGLPFQYFMEFKYNLSFASFPVCSFRVLRNLCSAQGFSIISLLLY